MPDALCLKCLKPIKTNSYKVQSSKCNKLCHRDCANLTIDRVQEFNKEKESEKQWVCTMCISPKEYTTKPVIHDIEKQTENKNNATLEFIKKENNYLKEIIRELRENNALLKQNKQLLEEKILGFEQKMGQQKPNQNNVLKIDRTNKNRKPLSLSTQVLATHPQMPPKSAPVISNQNQVETFNFQQTQTPHHNNSSRINSSADAVPPKTWAQVVEESNGEPSTSNVRRRRIIHIGTGETSDGETFTGRDDKNKKVWLFVSRVPDTIDESAMEKYIKNKANIKNEEDVIVKHIPTRIEQENPTVNVSK